MADITTELDLIKSSSYGEQVRTSIVSILTKINNDKILSGLSKLYRGNELGSGSTYNAAVSATQKSAISSGNFTNMYIGDYWTINGTVYRIADINYWKNVGDTNFTTNHLVLVPDGSLASASMNSSDITTGAYISSTMYTTALASIRTRLNTDFGSYLLSHRRTFPKTVVDGCQSAMAWYNSTVDLMNEKMVFGANICCKDLDGSYLETSDKMQLALFKLNPAMITNARYSYWLLDVASDTNFCRVDGNGAAVSSSASTSAGIRPVIAVKG